MFGQMVMVTLEAPNPASDTAIAREGAPSLAARRDRPRQQEGKRAQDDRGAVTAATTPRDLIAAPVQP